MNRRDDLQATGPAGGGFDSARLRGSLGRNDGGNRRSRRKCRDGGQRWRGDGDRRSRRWNGWRVVRGRRLEWRNGAGGAGTTGGGAGGSTGATGGGGDAGTGGPSGAAGTIGAGGRGGAGGTIGAGGRGGTTGTAGTGGNVGTGGATRHGRRRWTGRFQRAGSAGGQAASPERVAQPAAVRRAAPASQLGAVPPGITQTITVAKDGSGQSRA